MKKNIKRILVLLLVAIQIFLLCGCSALEEMREMQGFLNEDGTVTWQGNIYKELPRCDYLNTMFLYETPIYVTEPDVPVLLSMMFSSWNGYASENKQILTSFNIKETNYCIESEYEGICQRIQEPFEPEIVCYYYNVYNEETEEFEEASYTLTQEQLDAINLITETEEPTVLADGMYLETWDSIYLLECSADMLFMRDSMEISVSTSGSTYYLRLYTDEGDVLFTVPEGCKSIFDDIFKAYIDGKGKLIEDDLPADCYV